MPKKEKGCSHYDSYCNLNACKNCTFYEGKPKKNSKGEKKMAAKKAATIEKKCLSFFIIFRQEDGEICIEEYRDKRDALSFINDELSDFDFVENELYEIGRKEYTIIQGRYPEVKTAEKVIDIED